MRRPVLALVVGMLCTGAAAQSRPPKLEPLPEPPPAVARDGAEDEPRVRIAVPDGARVEPVRHGGRLIAVRVIPASGRPYYLVPAAERGGWLMQPSLDEGLSVPMFAIVEFD